MNFMVMTTKSCVNRKTHRQQEQTKKTAKKNLFGRTFTVETVNVINLPLLKCKILSKVTKFSNDLKIYSRRRSCEQHYEQIEISLFCTGHLIDWI